MTPKRQEIVYGWKPGARMTGDAQKVGQALERLEGADALTIVQAAKPKSSPLHTYIWSVGDKKAAYEYRCHLARHLVRSVVIVRETEDGPTPGPRAFYALPSRITDTEESDTEAGARVLVTLARARAIPELYAMVVADLRRDLAASRNRLAEFESPRVDNLLRRIDQLDQAAAKTVDAAA